MAGTMQGAAAARAELIAALQIRDAAPKAVLSAVL